MSGQLELTTTPSGDLIDASGRRWVTMSNALARAAHGLTLPEKRIMLMASATLDSRKPLGPGEAPKTRIAATDYAATFGLDDATAYNQLQAAAKTLYKRSVTFFEAAHRRKGKPLQPTEVHIRWVGRCTYAKGEGWVEVAWWHEILPHLTGLKRQFTTYQLEQASALRSVYSWKLLELLMRWANSPDAKKGNGWAEYSVEDFTESMQAQPSHRANFGKLRTKIIEPAVKELTEKDGWLINWEPIKKGRKVAAVRFEFRRDPQGRLPLETP
jgi:plasmid replication initiation protein